jgi:hypothetical protein
VKPSVFNDVLLPDIQLAPVVALQRKLVSPLAVRRRVDPPGEACGVEVGEGEHVARLRLDPRRVRGVGGVVQGRLDANDVRLLVRSQVRVDDLAALALPPVLGQHAAGALRLVRGAVEGGGEAQQEGEGEQHEG